MLPLLDRLLLALCLSAHRTAAFGCLLNGLIVIYGTVLMGHYGIASLAAKPPTTWTEALFGSMLLDIAIAWADFFAGKVLYKSWLREG